MIMKVILRIQFDSICHATFDIENPPVIPNEGEIVDFRWSEFIDDKNDLRLLTEYGEYGVWVANILCKTYAKDNVIVFVALMQEEHYKEHYGARF